MNFKINSRPLFTIIFKLKNDNFKTRDFSPLIERVLAGVNQLICVDITGEKCVFLLCADITGGKCVFLLIWK